MSILGDGILDMRSIIKRALPAQPCVLCGQMSHAGLWCEDCERALPYLHGLVCAGCALPIPSGTHCGLCLSHPHRFTRCTALCAYTFPWDKLIQQLKFGANLALADAFAIKLSERIDMSRLPDLVIAMPLHPNRLSERGYNQSVLLAHELALACGVAFSPQACRRVRDTAAQSSLAYKHRRKNMRNAFVCDIDLNGKRIALVDDVLTSGASLDALAEAVIKRGALEVEAWVVARTVRNAG